MIDLLTFILTHWKLLTHFDIKTGNFLLFIQFF